MIIFESKENQGLLFGYGFHLEPRVRRDLGNALKELAGTIEFVYGFDSVPGREVG